MNINQTILRHCLALDLEMTTWVELSPKQKRDLNLRAKKILHDLGGLAAAW
ncbi:hypothetical protein [Methylotenera sp.]|jgi:hypothetical protein|uniref:hypothetical protein n=1 Tax=Methylotenera sp. TaxID=2051956 RepID=UPI002716111F|nr:hypothetical protein [Methylotenera sp.]MDO9204403.1 hypothetical protein [Methylotenera sp.]MDP1523373.1 hypothetical protein [Methylotenera sp.]MDP1658319.1 hypothetical protein [Methylotenera sp.]MDP3819517.1 hypothetical protein [Methylotenera sp.]MDZ4210199.1 hypothetical protein [Methylotenera sp.]